MAKSEDVELLKMKQTGIIAEFDKIWKIIRSNKSELEG